MIRALIQAEAFVKTEVKVFAWESRVKYCVFQGVVRSADSSEAVIEGVDRYAGDTFRITPEKSSRICHRYGIVERTYPTSSVHVVLASHVAKERRAARRRKNSRALEGYGRN